MAKGMCSLIRSVMPNLAYVHYVMYLRAVLKGARTILDVGCGRNSPIQFVEAVAHGVDGYEPAIIKARERRTHSEHTVLDIRSLSKAFLPKSFDAVVALDVIEHLAKEEGYALIRSMEAIAAVKVVIFTPNGFLSQRSRQNGDLQEHLSGWESAEMREMGFKVRGVYGPRFLRTTEHELRFRPKIMCGIASEIMQTLYSFRHPERSAALLCVKEMSHSDFPLSHPAHAG